MSRRLVEKCLQAEGEEVILDVDATEIEAEKQEAQWTSNHVQGYMALLGYVNGVCVAPEWVDPKCRLGPDSLPALARA